MDNARLAAEMSLEVLARQLEGIRSDVAALHESVSARFDAADRRQAQQIGLLQAILARVAHS